MKAKIEGETIVPFASDPTVPVKGSSEEDFQVLVEDVASDKSPRYYLYCLDGNGEEFILIAFVPEDSNVRDKMLYASSHTALVRQLGPDKFKSEWYCNDASELAYKGLIEQLRHDETEAPLTEQEKYAKKELEDAVGLEQSTGMISGSLPFQPTKELLGSLERFKSNEVNFLEIKVEDNEDLGLVSALSVSNESEIDTNIKADDGRFYVIKYKPTAADGKVFFVFCCPDAVSIKTRMILATVKGTAVDIFKSNGIEFAKTLELSDTDVRSELDSEVKLMTETRELTNKTAFAKPKRPGRGKRRMIKK